MGIPPRVLYRFYIQAWSREPNARDLMESKNQSNEFDKPTSEL